MKKIFCSVFVLSVFSFAAFAQPAAYPTNPAHASDAVQAPTSGIDLLKRSLESSDVASAADGTSGKAAVVSSATVPAKPAASVQPAKQNASQTVRKTASSADNFLEMPLSSGAVVKTQVPVTKKKNTSRRVAARKTASARTSAKNAQSAASKKQPSAQKTTPAPTPVERDIEKNNALIDGERSGAKTSSSSAENTAQKQEASADALAQEEMDYAARLLRQARETADAGRFIPPPAAETAHTSSAPANRPFNPNDYRPGVEWKPSSTTHFTVYTQKRENGISSSNMGMIFESAYTTLRRNIPWMMSDKVRVFVYQDHNSYLKHEPNAKAWTRALAYPTRGEIVVYDEPGKQQELKEVFTHELVHIFTQKYFDKHKTGRLMTPEWLDEGLAVYMEDQAYSGTKGGPWANDFKTLNFQRSKDTQPANFSSSNMFGGARTFASGRSGKTGKPLYFMSFEDFMQSGSLSAMEGRGKTQDWYFQAYAMVRFLLNPAGGLSPSNRMQFEQFTRLMAQGEQVRDPRTGFPARDADGKPVYQPYSAEKALGRSYRYNTAANFEDAFWRWAAGAR